MWLVYDQISPSWTIHSLRGSVAKIMEAVADVAGLQSSQDPLKAKLHRLAGLRSSFAKGMAVLHRKIDVHGYELIPTEGHRKVTIGKLNHICHLLQRLFIAEVAAFEEEVSGTTRANAEIKGLPAQCKDELRVLIALVRGKPKDACARDQLERGTADDRPAAETPGEICPDSYSAELADLHITVNDLLERARALP
jgi:hypothetical protein